MPKSIHLKYPAKHHNAIEFSMHGKAIEVNFEFGVQGLTQTKWYSLFFYWFNRCIVQVSLERQANLR